MPPRITSWLRAFPSLCLASALFCLLPHALAAAPQAAASDDECQHPRSLVPAQKKAQAAASSTKTAGKAQTRQGSKKGKRFQDCRDDARRKAVLGDRDSSADPAAPVRAPLAPAPLAPVPKLTPATPRPALPAVAAPIPAPPPALMPMQAAPLPAFVPPPPAPPVAAPAAPLVAPVVPVAPATPVVAPVAPVVPPVVPAPVIPPPPVAPAPPVVPVIDPACPKGVCPPAGG